MDMKMKMKALESLMANMNMADRDSLLESMEKKDGVEDGEEPDRDEMEGKVSLADLLRSGKEDDPEDMADDEEEDPLAAKKGMRFSMASVAAKPMGKKGKY